MAHTYTNLIYHIVFSTQGHVPLKPEYRQELFAYIGGLVKEKGGKVIMINGVSDHVHCSYFCRPILPVSRRDEIC